MSHYRINVRTITPSQFNPPAGCTFSEVIASWHHAQMIVTQERQRMTMKIARERLQSVLFNEGVSDAEAIDQITQIMKRFGLIS